jgi:hypothetical protein
MISMLPTGAHSQAVVAGQRAEHCRRIARSLRPGHQHAIDWLYLVDRCRFRALSDDYLVNRASIHETGVAAATAAIRRLSDELLEKSATVDEHFGSIRKTVGR